MKKLLTKLTSVSLAALMASAGISASAFSDMADTENSVLTEKLGIITGYNDGTYKPNDMITRAEAVKIVLAARGEDEEDFLGEGDEIFPDVPKSHWAYKYIKQAYLDGFINGFEDGTFKPEENVSIDQMLRMLVSAVGYDTYAQATGGWTGGYRLYANTLGITADTEGDYTMDATRGTALDLTANTLNIPLCVIDSYEIDIFGERGPVFAVKDGEGADFGSLLTDKFKVYKVTATVKNMKNNAINIDITDAVNFDKKRITEKVPVSIKFKLSDIDATAFTEGKSYTMYIKINDSEEEDYEIIYACENNGE